MVMSLTATRCRTSGRRADGEWSQANIPVAADPEAVGSRDEAQDGEDVDAAFSVAGADASGESRTRAHKATADVDERDGRNRPIHGMAPWRPAVAIAWRVGDGARGDFRTEMMAARCRNRGAG